MFSVPRGVRGPTPGGAIDRWHSHVVCVKGVKRGLAPRPDGTCPTRGDESAGERDAARLAHVGPEERLRRARARCPSSVVTACCRRGRAGRARIAARCDRSTARPMRAATSGRPRRHASRSSLAARAPEPVVAGTPTGATGSPTASQPARSRRPPPSSGRGRRRRVPSSSRSSRRRRRRPVRTFTLRAVAANDLTVQRVVPGLAPATDTATPSRRRARVGRAHPVCSARRRGRRRASECGSRSPAMPTRPPPRTASRASTPSRCMGAWPTSATISTSTSATRSTRTASSPAPSRR